MSALHLMNLDQLPLPLRYGYALLITALALGARWALGPWLGDQVPFITLFGAVALVAWQVGAGPAAISALTGVVGANSFLLDSRYGLHIALWPGLLLHLIYLSGCALIIALAIQARRRGAQTEVALRRLRDSESQLHQILDALPMLISYVDSGLRYQFNNAAYREWFGLQPEQLKGKYLPDVLGAEAYAIVREPLQRALSGERVQMRTELNYQGAGRRQVSISMIPHRLGGQVAGYFAVIEDISDRLRGELERAHLAAIFESAADAVISKTLDGRVISWNAGAERLFGFSAAEMVGHSIERIIPPELVNEEQHILEELRRGERLKHFETERLSRDGRRLPLSMTVSPIRAEDGSVVGASNISRDISERRLAEAQLKAADRRKDEFLAMLAHELRNPLAPILNAAQFMQMHGDLPDTLAPARAIIERQASHMRRLVDELLDLSRINRGHIALQRQPLDLVVLLSAVVEAWWPQVRGAGLTLDWVPAEAIPLHADDTRLSQVFGNLLSNALKYTPQGGRISLTITRLEQDVEVRCADTGIGLAPDQLEAVFEMFAQVDATLARSRSGLGIGLTLARQLVELHGGRLFAESAGVGHGSVFVVRLPLASAATATTTSGPLPSPTVTGDPATRPLRLLLAEDHPDVADSMTLMLELAGYRVLLARDGAAALELATQAQPDVALLDIGMPLLNGYEVAQRIRCQPGGQAIRLIALTGWGQEEDRQRAFAAGFDAHCTKPVDFAALRALIESPLPKPATRP